MLLDPESDVLNVFALDDGVYREQEIGDELVLEICGQCSLRLPIARVFS